MVNVSIDPSINHVGYVCWLNGHPIKHGTIHSQGDSELEKVVSIKLQLEAVFFSIIEDYDEQIDRVVVESFERHTQNNNMLSMMKCSLAQGVILATAHEWCEQIDMISKHQAKKGEAAMLAKSMGCLGSEHMCDALHLGVLAGLNEKATGRA